MAHDQWLYSKGDDHQKGPVSAKELQRLAESGELHADDLLWKEGMNEWLLASKLKGLKFPTAEPPASRPPKTLDKDSLKSTFEDARRKMDEAAGVLWFLDLKFSRFVSATIIRVVWSLYLLFGTLGLALSVVASVFRYPIFEALLWSVLGILGFAFFTLMFRVCLEALMIIFRMAEHLRQMNDRLASK